MRKIIFLFGFLLFNGLLFANSDINEPIKIDYQLEKVEKVTCFTYESSCGEYGTFCFEGSVTREKMDDMLREFDRFMCGPEEPDTGME